MIGIYSLPSSVHLLHVTTVFQRNYVSSVSLDADIILHGKMLCKRYYQAAVANVVTNKKTTQLRVVASDEQFGHEPV